MKRMLLSACFLFLLMAGYAQPSDVAPLVGHWEGTLLWYRQPGKEPQKVRMQLVIRPTDTAHVYTWQLIYGDKQEDNRPYLLKPVDTAAGHWQIDERNGIVIDQYFTGNRFTSAFSVQTTTIVDSYWREGESLVAEFYSFSSTPVSTTGSGTDESPKVSSYAAKGYQRAVLHRKE